jgi:hypothetical protein
MPNLPIRCLKGECKDCSPVENKPYNPDCNYGARAIKVLLGQDCIRGKTKPDATKNSIIYVMSGPGQDALPKILTPQQMGRYELIPGEIDVYYPRGTIKNLSEIYAESERSQRAIPVECLQPA